MYHVDNGVMPTHGWQGLTIRDLTPPGAGWQASFIEIDVPTGAVHPIARSTKCETFYYCDSGELEFEVNDQHFQVKPGDLVEIKPNEWYGYRTGNAPARLLSFNVPPYEASATEYRES
jgi:quercetin dioxygenase-like cupin family protein